MPAYYIKGKGWKIRFYANDIYGNRKQFERKWFNTKKEALAIEKDFRNSKETEINNITFEELWEEYSNYKKLHLKAQSFRAVASRFENHLLPYFKNYKINNITSGIYINWQQEIEKKGFKYKYNSSLHGAMVNILNYAIKFYGLKSNVASLAGNFKRKTELKKNVNFFTFEEYQNFISVVSDNIYKTLFETLYYTGLRLGEALALNWNDFKDSNLNINKTISKETINGRRIINTPKTQKSIRVVKLDKKLNEEIEELKTYYQKYEGFNDDWFIFGGLNPLAPSTIERKKNKYCEMANVKK